MKKLALLLLSIALVLSSVLVFTSCGDEKTSGEDENKTTNSSEAASEATSETASEVTSEEASEGTTEEKVLKMATNAYFPPYEYYEGESIVGIDAEIAALIAEKLGMKLEIVDMSFDSILSAVNAGTVDFGMAGMTVNEDRLKEVDFSNSYAKGVQSVIVKNDSPITSVDDLSAEGATYKIGVQLGTTGDTYSTDDFGAERVTQYPTGNEAVSALLKGDVDCVIIDNEPAKAYVSANEGIKTLETAYADEDYAICVKKGNTELLEKINTAIYELTKDGSIANIVSKYIKE